MPQIRKETTITDSTKTLQQSESDSRGFTNKDRLSNYFAGQALRTSPFGGSISSESLYKRAERLAAAAHLVTAHISEIEPLRAEVRKESLALLHYTLRVYAELRASGSEHVRDLQASVRTLISYLRILGVTGRVSTQNMTILVDALDELGNFPNMVQKSSLAEAVALSRDDLIPRIEMDKKTRPSPVDRGDRTIAPRTGESVKDNLVKDTSARKDRPADSRTVRIMDILHSGGRLGIKDIVSNLPEYSEKMIQRDLAVLVLKNQVRKIGEKRWSQYELVH